MEGLAGERPVCTAFVERIVPAHRTARATQGYFLQAHRDFALKAWGFYPDEPRSYGRIARTRTFDPLRPATKVRSRKG